jgi:hypothetical protein
LLATALHGFYDFFLFQNLTAGLYIGAFISLVVGIRFSFKAMRLHNQRSPFHPDAAAAAAENPPDAFESPHKPS